MNKVQFLNEWDAKWNWEIKVFYFENSEQKRRVQFSKISFQIWNQKKTSYNSFFSFFVDMVLYNKDYTPVIPTAPW